MEPRWSEGVWLGKTAKSDEHIISDDTGWVVKAGGISLKTENESWKDDVVMGGEMYPGGLNEQRVVRRTSIMIPPIPGNPEQAPRQQVCEPDERDGPDMRNPWRRTEVHQTSTSGTGT